MQNKGSLNYSVRHPLYKSSTFGIGGKAKYFLLPKTEDALIETIKAAEKENIPYIVIGNASNLLFDDSGYCGAVISTVKMSGIFFIEEKHTGRNLLFALCGAKLPVLSGKALQYGLRGFEGLCSIPATVGGALCSNAGAFGSEISDFLECVKVFSVKEDKVIVKSKNDCVFSYRKSRAAEQGEIILSACFSCEKGDAAEIAEKMQLYKAKRYASQPVGVKSCGCYFKTPNESFWEDSKGKSLSAGALIDSCGLKGLSYGSAAVSETHGNFLINTEEKGSSEDVLKLARIVKDAVYSKTGIALSEEVVYVPNPKKKFVN